MKKLDKEVKRYCSFDIVPIRRPGNFLPISEHDVVMLRGFITEDILMFMKKPISFTAMPTEWSPTFIDENGLKGVVTVFWSRQTFLPNGTQYELFNVLIFDNRDTLYIRNTAKKYFSSTPKNRLCKSGL